LILAASACPSMRGIITSRGGDPVRACDSVTRAPSARPKPRRRSTRARGTDQHLANGRVVLDDMTTLEPPGSRRHRRGTTGAGGGSGAAAITGAGIAATEGPSGRQRSRAERRRAGGGGRARGAGPGSGGEPAQREPCGGRGGEDAREPEQLAAQPGELRRCRGDRTAGGLPSLSGG